MRRLRRARDARLADDYRGAVAARRRREGRARPGAADAAVCPALFLSQGYLEANRSRSAARLRSEFIPTAKTAIPCWCAAHCVTISLPAAWRIAWASTAAVGWNAILSYRNSRAKLRESREEAFHDD